MSKRRHAPRYLRFAILMVLAAALSACGPAAGPQQPTELIVYGPYGHCKVVDAAVTPVMLEKYNTKVVCQDMMAAEAYTKTFAQKDKPEVTVVSTDAVNFLTGLKAGLWAKLDPAILTNWSQLQDPARVAPFNEYGVAFAASVLGIQYNTDIFKQKGFAPPKSWSDFFRPEFKGRLGLTSTTSGVGPRQLIAWARTKGGNERNIDPGFAIAKQLVDAGQVASFPGTSTVLNQAMQQGEMWIANTILEAALDFKNNGGPVAFVIPEEGGGLTFSTFQIVKGGPNEKLGQQFINLILGEDYQVNMAKIRFSTPTRKGLQLPAELAQALPVDPAQWKAMWQPDYEYLSLNRAAWHERWMKEIERKQ